MDRHIYFRHTDEYYEEERAYIMETYKDLPVKIYFDEKYKVYACPLVLEEYSADADLLCYEIAMDSPSYDYINPAASKDLDLHCHHLMDMFKEAYCNPNSVVIPEKYKNQYSVQALQHIKNLIERGKVEKPDWYKLKLEDIKGELTFHFVVNGEIQCVDQISLAYLSAFNDGCNFEIPVEYKNEYSSQEMILIEKLNKLAKKYNVNN